MPWRPRPRRRLGYDARQFSLPPAPMRPSRPALLPPLLIALALLAGPGCVYRMTIQQGNLLEAEQIDQLETGMTRSQVQFLLGTPMVPPAFDETRWDYYYFLKSSRLQEPVTVRLTVWFENDRVSKIDRPPEGIPGLTSPQQPTNPASSEEPAAAPPNG